MKTCSNGLPELSTNFLSSIIQNIKPKNMSDIVLIEGISHGSGLWIGGQCEPLRAGIIKKEDLFGTREQINKLLIKGGLDKVVAFGLVEKLRKGKPLTKEEIVLIESTSLKREVIKNILKVSYLFPEANE